MKTAYKILGISAALALVAYTFVKWPCVKAHWNRYKEKTSEATGLEVDYREWEQRCSGEVEGLDKLRCDAEGVWQEHQRVKAEKLKQDAKVALEEAVKSFF